MLKIFERLWGGHLTPSYKQDKGKVAIFFNFVSEHVKYTRAIFRIKARETYSIGDTPVSEVICKIIPCLDFPMLCSVVKLNILNFLFSLLFQKALRNRMNQDIGSYAN